MSKFSFIKSLSDQAEDKAILEAINTDGLTRSSFFKAIQTQKPELADVLESFWGRIDFVEFCELTLNSIKLKKGKWKDLNITCQEHLNKLVLLHDKLFPAIAKKVAKLPTNYSNKNVISATASSRSAERDWLARMQTV